MTREEIEERPSALFANGVAPPAVTDAERVASEPLIFIQSDRPSSLFDLLRRRRGWTDEYIANINDPNYAVLKDMDTMVAALHAIRSQGRQIVVMPDFDMDGITSGIIAYAGLAELGFNVGLYVPDFRRGHDLTPAAVDEMFSRFPGASAVVTTDSGVNSHAGVARARALGLEVLVTDHHVQLDDLSPADVIVDPSRIDEDYPHPGICGAFVMWQVVKAYAVRHRPDKSRDIDLLRLFAGIGTVSDVMPLTYENRQVVRDSLAIAKLLYVPLPPEDSATPYDVEQAALMVLLRAESHSLPYVDAFEGFAHVLRAFREHGPLETRLDEDGEPLLDDDTGLPIVDRRPGKLRSSDAIAEDFYGFYLAPAFNAIRRIDGDMRYAFGAFTAPTPAQKLACAEQVIDYNLRRRELTEEHMAELDGQDQPLAPWVWLTSAPTGMMGLLASKLMQREGHPVVVVGRRDDPSAPRGGSARAPGWFNVISEMTAAGFTAVGHEQACGVRMRDEAQMEAFAAHLAARSQEVLQRGIDSGAFAAANAPDIVLGDTERCDATLDEVDDILDLATAMDSMRPFGHGFPRPEMELVVNLASCKLQAIGKDLSHLRIVTASGLKLLWWGMADMLPELAERAGSVVPSESVITLRADLQVNVFRGTATPQLIVDREVGEDGAPA